jgi:hypothetical protein
MSISVNDAMPKSLATEIKETIIEWLEFDELTKKRITG